MFIYNDLIADGHAHACAFTDAFGGEEGIEYFMLDVISYSRPVICNGDGQIFGLACC